MHMSINDDDKTREELLAELHALRLERAEAARPDPKSSLSHNLIESIPHNIFGKDLDGRFIFANKQYCQTIGVPLKALLGKSDYELHPFEQAEQYRRDDRKVINANTPLVQEEEFTRLDGTTRFIKVIKAPIEENNKTVGTFGVFWDITDHKNAEMELRASKERYRELVENAGSVIIRLSAEGTITFINEHVESTFGYTKDDLIGNNIIGTILPEKDEAGRDLTLMIKEIIRSPESYKFNENENIHKDGSRSWFRWANKAIRNKDGKVVEILCTGADITERVQAMQAMQDMTQRSEMAQAASQAKSEFLATMSHEIRTPMNSILGMAELISETTLSDEQSQLLSTLRQSGDHLVTLIEDILDITRIESGNLELTSDPVPLQDFAKNCVAILQSEADKKGLELIVTIKTTVPPSIVCDKTRLRQILLNLLGNAIKFTHKGQVSLTVSYGGRDGQIKFTVTDTGIGIPAHMLEDVFTPFTQADSSMTRRYGGVGLGLTICRRLAAFMGGKVQLRAIDGNGTEATLSIPVTPTP